MRRLLSSFTLTGYFLAATYVPAWLDSRSASPQIQANSNRSSILDEQRTSLNLRQAITTINPGSDHDARTSDSHQNGQDETTVAINLPEILNLSPEHPSK
ncbi:MAG: hypothetical protein ACFBSC_20475 [Microcoleaceae cyanobacterium]